MSYAFFDTQQRLIRALATSAPDGYGGPGAARAWRDWLLRSACAFEQAPPFAIGSVCSNGNPIPIHESIADELPVGVLRKFGRTRIAPAPAGQWPVFLCAPLAGHHAVMLRETVETLLENRDVYITDWADARDVPADAGALALDDYVLALERFIGCARTHGAPLHIVAICQASVPALAAVALLAKRQPAPFASVSLLAGPIDTRISPTPLDQFARSHTLDWFRDNVMEVVPSPYGGAGRRVYPGVLQQSAIIAAQPERHLGLEMRYWSSWLAGNLPDASRALRSLNEYAAVLDMAECYLLDTIRVIFHDHLLARGTWSIAERHVETRALRDTPLFTLEGDRDDITGAGQTHCAHALCGVPRVHANRRLTVPDCDHYDLFTGPRWRETVHPSLCNFWQAVESGAPTLARAPGEARPALSRQA